MDINLIIHTVASVIGLLVGGPIFLSPKGTSFHKKLGYIYTVSMIIILITSFFIFQLFDSFGVYHVCSIISGVTLMIGLYFPLFGRSFQSWAQQHMIWMCYSYIGLLMAGGSHLFEVFPDWPALLRVILFWVLPYVLGTIMIFKTKNTTVKAALKNIKN